MMYAKLFSRITESSLMEESVTTRYVFMILLAMSDSRGLVVGTDVAICRRMNISNEDYLAALERLMSPDPNSNSKEFEGRRILKSDGERGYQIVNYQKYRGIKDAEDRRIYMRQYMAKKRDVEKADADENVNSKSLQELTVNTCKHQLTRLTHTEAEADANTEEKKEDGRNECSPAQNLELSIDVPKTEKPKTQTDIEWLESLKTNRAYQGIDIDAQHAKAQIWCNLKKRKCSRLFFVKWLNRIEQPMVEAKPKTVVDPNTGEEYVPFFTPES